MFKLIRATFLGLISLAFVSSLMQTLRSYLGVELIQLVNKKLT